MSEHSVWAYKRNIGFTKKLLLSSFTEKKMFKQKTCAFHNIFKFIRVMLGLYWQKKSALIREAILIESRVAMTLQMLV